MAIQLIDLGASANNGLGDKLRIGGDKINDNFQEIEDKILTGTFQVIGSLADLPTPISNVITLADNTTYYFVTSLDLLGNTLQLGVNTALRGSSSLNSALYSSVSIGNFINSPSNVDVANLGFDGTNCVGVFISANGNPGTDNVFFTSCTIKNFNLLGGLGNYASIIFNNCTISNSAELEFDSTIGTLAFDNCLFIPAASSIVLLSLLSTCAITRRFRIIYSSFICNSTSVGISVSPLATIPDESYILDTVSFSGVSPAYIGGVTQTSNKALFLNCRGVTNTSVIGQAYMIGNATATTIASSSTFVKVAGTTTAGAENSKYLHSNNRLTCDAAIERKYTVICQLSFTSGNNQTCEFGFYDSELAGIRIASRTMVTTNGSGLSENVSFTSIISHKQLDFIEVHCANNSSATNITVTSMNFIITEIK